MNDTDPSPASHSPSRPGVRPCERRARKVERGLAHRAPAALSRTVNHEMPVSARRHCHIEQAEAAFGRNRTSPSLLRRITR
jgi:hypothetical protein